MTCTTSTAEIDARVAELRAQTENYLHICQMEMEKAAPDFDRAFDFADKALRAVGTLRIMTMVGGVSA